MKIAAIDESNWLGRLSHLSQKAIFNAAQISPPSFPGTPGKEVIPVALLGGLASLGRKAYANALFTKHKLTYEKLMQGNEHAVSLASLTGDIPDAGLMLRSDVSAVLKLADIKASEVNAHHTSTGDLLLALLEQGDEEVYAAIRNAGVDPTQFLAEVNSNHLISKTYAGISNRSV